MYEKLPGGEEGAKGREGEPTWERVRRKGDKICVVGGVVDVSLGVLDKGVRGLEGGGAGSHANPSGHGNAGDIAEGDGKASRGEVGKEGVREGVSRGGSEALKGVSFGGEGGGGRGREGGDIG